MLKDLKSLSLLLTHDKFQGSALTPDIGYDSSNLPVYQRKFSSYIFQELRKEFPDLKRKGGHKHGINAAL